MALGDLGDVKIVKGIPQLSDGCVWKCCVPLNPMVNDHYPVFKWLFHWEYTPFSDIPRWQWSWSRIIARGVEPHQLILDRASGFICCMLHQKKHQMSPLGPAKLSAHRTGESLFLDETWAKASGFAKEMAEKAVPTREDGGLRSKRSDNYCIQRSGMIRIHEFLGIPIHQAVRTSILEWKRAWNNTAHLNGFLWKCWVNIF